MTQTETKNRISWIKDLVKAEEQVEESGVIDITLGISNERSLLFETNRFLQDLKDDFVDASNIFNDMKKSSVGRIKIYGIAKTQADFMLFRNGYKLIFSLQTPGVISIRFNFIGPSNYLAVPTASNLPLSQTHSSKNTYQSNPSSSSPLDSNAPSPASPVSGLLEERLLIAKQGPLADLNWTYLDHIVQRENIVKYHLSLFIRESAR